jgi:hypothetical protein
MAEDPFDHSINTHPITKNYREAVAWSKKKSAERVSSIRSQNPDVQQVFAEAAKEDRVICEVCGMDLCAETVKATDRLCICGCKLFLATGEPTTNARIIHGAL